MSDLTNDERVFLKKHNIPFDLLHNSKDQRAKDYKLLMKESGKLFAYNTFPCKSFGHKLRSRSGHCIQCNTAMIAYQLRHYSAGMVYIAGSKKLKSIKIGFTRDISIRSISLNTNWYAGVNDWELLYAIESDSAGIIESEVNNKIRAYAHSYDYNHDGNWHNTKETFKCSYAIALNLFEDMALKHKFELKLKKPVNGYDFPS